MVAVVGRCVVAMAAVAAVLAIAPVTVGAQQGGFSDVEPGSHKPAIDALNELGVFEGTLCGDAMYCPGDPIQRSTMAVWLVRALEDEAPAPIEASRFDDVDAAVWWAPYVERIAELGITAGCKLEPLRYCPDRSVTRGQMATFLVQAFDLEPASSAGFDDTRGSAHEADIDSLFAAGITAGCRQEPLSYCPSRPVTRGQMATFLAQALGLLEVPCPSDDLRESIKPRGEGVDVIAGSLPIYFHDACNRQIIVDSGLVENAVQPVAVFYDSNDFFQVTVTESGETVTTPRTMSGFIEALDKALAAYAEAVENDPQQTTVTRPTVSWSNYDNEDDSVRAWFQLAIAK